MSIVTPEIRECGAYTAQTAIWLADRDGHRRQRLPVDIPVQGTISYNEDRTVKRSLSLEINHPERLTPFRDYLIPETTITDAAGTVTTRPWGLFLATPPKTNLTGTRYSGTIKAVDLTWLLSKDTLPDGMVVDAGTDPGQAAREIATAVLDARQVAIPNMGMTLDHAYAPDPGTTRLAAMTALLDTAGWYAPWMDSSGTIRSARQRDPQTASPKRRYTVPGDTVTIVPPVTGTPNWDRLRNQVTVFATRPDQPPIFATVEVTNRASPVHPANLGTPEHPLWLTDPVEDAEIKTKAAARAKAERLLAQGVNWYRSLRVRTLVDQGADAHDVIALDVHHQGAHFTGNWVRRTWTVKLRGVTAVMDADVSATMPWQ